MKKWIYRCLIALCVMASFSADASLQLHGLFDSGMVLQRGIEVPVWGWDDPGVSVTVEFSGQTQRAVADVDGKWMVRLDSLALSTSPQTMLIYTDNETNTLTNILVGDVWNCAGQSNMAVGMGGYTDAVASATNSMIRFFSASAGTASEGPLEDISADWKVCSPDTVGGLSAVAYFFAEELQRENNVPIGLLRTTYAGGCAEAKMSIEALAATPAGAKYIATVSSNAYGSAQWPAADYNASIAPLIPFAIKGACWYQGEHNASRADSYAEIMHALIGDWRTRWGQGDFPFLIVQLPRYGGDPEPRWAKLREAQEQIASAESVCEMVCAIDTGHETDIHAGNKEPIGRRLASLARAMVYGEDVVFSGPRVESVIPDGTNLMVNFEFADDGLVSSGGDLVGFEAAGMNQEFFPVEAVVVSPTSVVLSASIPILHARYAYSGYPENNLINMEGWPAAPFQVLTEVPKVPPGVYASTNMPEERVVASYVPTGSTTGYGVLRKVEPGARWENRLAGFTFRPGAGYKLDSLTLRASSDESFGDQSPDFSGLQLALLEDTTGDGFGDTEVFSQTNISIANVSWSSGDYLTIPFDAPTPETSGNVYQFELYWSGVAVGNDIGFQRAANTAPTGDDVYLLDQAPHDGVFPYISGSWYSASDQRNPTFFVTEALPTPEELYWDWINGYPDITFYVNPTDDADQDGLSNFEEWAFGGEPNVSTNRGYAPSFHVVEADGTSFFELRYIRRVEAVNVHVECTTNLSEGAWGTEAVLVGVDDDAAVGSAFELITNRVSVENVDTQYLRMVIE